MVSGKALRPLSDFLHDLYRLQDPAEVLQTVDRYASRLAPCDLAVPALTDRPSGSVVLEGVSRDYLESYRRHAGEDLSRLAHLQQRHRGAVRLSEFVSRRELERTAIWNEVMRPHRIRHVMTMCLLENARIVAVLKLIRSGSGRDFSIAERDVLALAAPHVRQAYANAEAIAGLTQEARRLPEVADRLPIGVLIAKDSGQVVYQNRVAEAWCARFFGGPARRGPAVSPGLPEPLRRLLRPLRAQATFVGPDGSALTARAARLGRRGELLVVLEEERRASVAHDRLSAREREVLRWVAEGKTNPEIGVILGISPRTVQTHLEHVYGKLGVVSRAQAVAELAKIQSRSEVPF